ncbi:MAG: DUF481 domain-containing protein [Lentisphaeria bacterium]|nr:DUF481 domain-containing protein [Lentisphaeria bacterium]
MKKLLSAIAGVILATSAMADRFTLSDGSVINGTLKSITDGNAVIVTDFAGEITVAADKLLKLNTTDSVEVSTVNGDRVSGSLNVGGDEQAASGAISLPMADIKYLWTAGMEDPTLPPSRKWDGEVSLDITGKTGNVEKFNGGIGTVASLTGPVDKLKLYAKADYGRESHVTTTKKAVAGIDYEQKISDSSAIWYANAEAEHNTPSGLRIREEANVGGGYYVIDEAKTKLRLRAGFNAKSRKFTDGSHSDTTGLELGLHFERDIQEWGKLVTDLTYQPTFDSIHDYRVIHESSLDIPVIFQYPLSLRVGVTNEYNSVPAPGAKRMDTSYFAKMVFKWK